MGNAKKRTYVVTKLSVNEKELIEFVLRQIRIKANQLDFEDLKENLNTQLMVYGLKLWSNSKNTFPYCDSIS